MSAAAAAPISIPLLLTLIVSLVNFFQPGEYTDLPRNTQEVDLLHTYDYIIVGGGSAGNTVL